MGTILKTALYDMHKELNANIVDYHGVYLPVFYSSIQDEHNSVRNNAGVFDVSHMGIIGINFTDKIKAIDALNYIFANDYSGIVPGKVIYSTMLDENGGAIDDLFVMCITETEYVLIVNFTNKEKDFAWISSKIGKESISMKNLSLSNGIVAVQGPKAYEIMKNELKLDIDGMKRFGVKRIHYDGRQILVSRTGYTGEDGFEVYIDNKSIVKFFKELVEKGSGHGLKPCGLGCRDTLRLEASYPLYGQELDDRHTPLQSMVSWSVKLNKKSDFIGKKAMLNMDPDKFPETLIGFEIPGKSIPRTGMEIIDDKNNKIGYVTSGTYSPTLKKNIGMAYVKKEFENSGLLSIKIRNKIEKIDIIGLPFYKRSFK